MNAFLIFKVYIDMNAAIDIGNTSCKLGLFEGNRLISLEKNLKIEAIVKKLIKVKVGNTIVCSVSVPELELRKPFRSIQNVLFLNKKTAIPIKNEYKTPETLGYDRLAAAVGASFKFPNDNCLIIDLGTAIKYDFVDNNGNFKGGIISPGLEMRFRALHTFTKNLPLLKASDIPELIGDTTKSCMQSGVLNGISAEINGFIGQYLRLGNLKIIISGGDANFFESQINYPTFAASNLVLEGLNRILIHNVENKIFNS